MRKGETMRAFTSLAFAAAALLIGLSGNAFAGLAPARVPEPATLTLLAVGFGGVAVARYFKRK
jgi:PEP-CTERM motif